VKGNLNINTLLYIMSEGMINMTVTHADASSLYLSKFYWSWRHFLFSYTIQMVQLVKLDIASFLKLHME